MKYSLVTYSINEIGQRTNQEDSVWPAVDKSPTNSDFYVLCDGMGGHDSGEVASQAVCSAISDYLQNHERKDGCFDETDFTAALDCAYDLLDEKDTGALKKMGTTLTFVKFHDNGCFIAHIGDSRIYHIRPSEHKVLYVTRDHSLVNDLIQIGELTPEEAKTFNQRNVITRAMQPNQDRRAKADINNLTDIQVNDYVYMCSDGMLEQMTDNELVNVLSMRRSDEKKISILKGATADNKDNHSAHLIRVVHIQDDEVSTQEKSVTVEEKNKPKTTGVSWIKWVIMIFSLIAALLCVWKLLL